MGTPLNGYIKLYRQMLDWGWYDDTNTKVVFLHLLLTASFKDVEWHGIQLKRGDVVTSRRSLAEDLKMSERNVRTALEHLKTTHEVTIKTYPKYSIISIQNYDLYQMTDPQTDPQPTSNRPSSDPQPTSNRPHRNNVKNVRSKEGKNVVVYDKIKEVFELFNQICISLDRIENPTKNNIRKVSEILQQHSDFDFNDFFVRVEKSDFLTGRNGRWNIGGTKATFDWILKPENILKINSGQYDNTEENNTDGRNSSISDEDLELVQGIGTWY